MHEGEKLKRLLESKRYQKTTFGEKAGGVSKQAVNKWVKEPRFSDFVWTKVKIGLIALGLNPFEIRPEDRDPGPSEDLTKLVERWPREQLTALRRILASDDASKDRLIAYLDGALRPFP